jgi:hypothetical protein
MIRLIDDKERVLETFKWQFNRKNINKIAYNYDAKVMKFDKGMAILKDNQGRLLFADEISKRFMKKLKETTVAGNYPDVGGIAGDDDRPPGNILIGTKFKETDYFNKLTTFNRNWDYDDGEWEWGHFENTLGMEDFDNYSDTLKFMRPLFPKKTWRNVWKRMSNIPDNVMRKEFIKQKKLHRTTKQQLGKEEVDTIAIDRIDKLLGKIEKLTM